MFWLRWMLMSGLLLAGWAGAGELRGIVHGQRTITAAESPLVLPATVTVAKGASLVIEAGVTLRLGEGACLIVEGQVHALGEKRLPVRFEPLIEGRRWGNVKILGDKDPPSYDAERRYIEGSGGSRLIQCEFTGGGAVADDQYDGGALYLKGSAPIVRDCLFLENEADRGGALVCYNFATPLIEACTFERNVSLLDDGGALYCFFYSDAVIVRNFFVLNRSARHAGGLYISVSNAHVEENAFIDNTSAGWGGAIYVSSSSPRLLGNALYEATGEDRSTGIVFQADCRPEVRDNSLMSGGVEVYGLNLGEDLDLSGNWWGTTEEYYIQGKVQQLGRGQDRRLVVAPWRERPSANLLTQPVEILSLHAMADQEWADTLAFDLCDRALARIQVRAVDRNKYAVDQTGIEVRILERPDQVQTVYLAETEKASGVFQGRVAINRRGEDLPSVSVAVGEHLLFSSTTNPDIRRLYRVDEARPVVHGLVLLSDPDPTHAIEEAPRLGWEYFSLLGDPQEAWHLQVASDSSFRRADLWDSGPRPLGPAGRVLTYEGLPLADGERYFLRLRGQGGGAWSDWKRFVVRTDGPLNTLRMNSLPPLPDQLEPAPEALLGQARPTFKVRSVVDREGDPVFYEIQLSADEYGQQILAGSGEDWSEAAWSSPRDLPDNSACWWRIRVHDGFESGDWSQPRRFHVNTVEEAPLPFDLIGPSGVIAVLDPEFSWTASSDPDPLATIQYTLLIGRQESLQDATRLAGLEQTSHRPRQPLVNQQPLWWAVEAVDNTGRVTRSRQVLRLEPDTTPSTPEPLAPAGGEDALAGRTLRFTPAQDPCPDDILLYELQVAPAGADFSRPLIHMKGLAQQELAALSLDALPDSRLLQEDQSYAWRLRAVDNHGAASPWSDAAVCWMNRANQPPSRPEPLLPEEGLVLRQGPLLSWTAASDPDQSDPPSTLSYVIQLCQEADFKGRVVEERLLAQTQVDFEGRLGDNTRWHWRVQAMDDENTGSGWGPVRSFILNRVEEAPTGLAWVEPAEGASLAALDRMDLGWTAATDPDWQARLSYTWRLSPAGDAARTLAEGSTAETKATVRLPLTSGEDYLLHLKVVDETGLEQVLPARRVRVDSHPTPPRPQAHAEELGPGDQLAWSAAQDPDPADRLSYRLEIRDEGGRVLVTTTQTALQVALGRLPGAAQLPEDQVLSWTVTAVDPHGLEAASSASTFWYNKANDPPGAPSFAPELAASPVLRTDRPTLPFIPGVDRDRSDPPSTLWHEVQVASHPSFQNAVTHRVPAGEKTVGGLLLDDNSVWHLRLRCLDDEGAASPWSDPIQVTVNQREDAPSAPQLREPAPGQRSTDLSGISLSWSASTDPDPGARLRYRVTVEEGAGAWREVLETEQTSLRVSRAIPNDSELRLTVTAVDDTGLETASQPLRITVDSRPGGTSLSGRPGQVLGTGDELAWTEATDPDPADRLQYEVAWSSSRAFTDGSSRLVAALRLPLSEWPELPENSDLWFRVRARDPHGLEGTWSEPWPAQVDRRNDPPAWKGGLRPASGRLAAGEQRLEWEAPTDPDRRPQQVEVEVQAAADSEFRSVLWTRRAGTATFLPLTLEPGRLWLRARAVDQDGATSAWSPVVAWTVDAPAPPAP
jgi:hypothetical protein